MLNFLSEIPKCLKLLRQFVIKVSYFAKNWQNIDRNSHSFLLHKKLIQCCFFIWFFSEWFSLLDDWNLSVTYLEALSFVWHFVSGNKLQLLVLCRKTVGHLLVVCWYTIGHLWPTIPLTVDCLAADCLSTVGRWICRGADKFFNSSTFLLCSYQCYAQGGGDHGMRWGPWTSVCTAHVGNLNINVGPRIRKFEQC